MLRTVTNIAVFAFLTVLTQIGGLAWLVALTFRRRVIAFLCIYAVATVATVWIAPLFGRSALSCLDNGSLQVRSWIFCATNRNYVTPEVKAVLLDASTSVNKAFPGTVTQVLDANFPFLDGFPLLPHLSHDDGEKVDLAFYYARDDGYLPGRTRSPVGYFAFEDGPTTCEEAWPTLRWDLQPLQRLWPDYTLETARTRVLIDVLVADPRVGKVFVEPHLKERLDVTHEKIRFQGCRAARHDDHIHVQL